MKNRIAHKFTFRMTQREASILFRKVKRGVESVRAREEKNSDRGLVPYSVEGSDRYLTALLLKPVLFRLNSGQREALRYNSVQFRKAGQQVEGSFHIKVQGRLI